MRRIVSTILVVTLLALAPLGSVAYAEHITEQVLLDQLGKIKAMISEIETKMKTKQMMMSHKAMDKTMDMLMEVTTLLRNMSSDIR